MRIRVRSKDTGETFKLEVSGQTTVADLLAAVRIRFGEQLLEQSDNIVISLNKKDPLQGNPNVSLSSLGICNGDLVWMLSPCVAPVQQQIHTEGPSGTSSSLLQQQQPDAMEEEYDIQLDAAPVDLGIPSHLIRALRANPNLASSEHGVAVLVSYAAMLETGFQAAGCDEDVISSETGIMENTHRIEYSLLAAPRTKCVVTCSSMNAVHLVVAEAPGDQARSMQCTSLMVENMRAAYIAHDDSELREDTSGDRRERFLQQDHSQRILWIQMKDKIAIPMQAACCAAADLAPPAGLLTLPVEIKMRLMGSLEPLDLVALASTCPELRYLAAAESLWEPLFRSCFPSPPIYVEELLPRRGFKWAFGFCWTERRKRDEDAARLRRRRRRFAPHIGQAPPFYPPPQFPGIVGGDHDRLPFLGGTGSRGSFGFGRQSQGSSSRGMNWFG